jgi:hypothetical protein
MNLNTISFFALVGKANKCFFTGGFDELGFYGPMLSIEGVCVPQEQKLSWNMWWSLKTIYDNLIDSQISWHDVLCVA